MLGCQLCAFLVIFAAWAVLIVGPDIRRQQILCYLLESTLYFLRFRKFYRYSTVSLPSLYKLISDGRLTLKMSLFNATFQFNSLLLII